MISGGIAAPEGPRTYNLSSRKVIDTLGRPRSKSGGE